MHRAATLGPGSELTPLLFEPFDVSRTLEMF
jgi:hypothetical protein